MPQTAVIIGLAATCRRLVGQLDLLDESPRVLGWVLTDEPTTGHTDPVLGTLDELDTVLETHHPDVALVTLPAVMTEQVRTIRTHLRRRGIADRFMPTLEDQLAGVGPRTHLDIDPGSLLDRPTRRIDEDAVRAVIAGRRVLITGAGGSIGSELARIVARYAPDHLTLVDRSENALFEIDRQIARRAPALTREALLHDVVDASGTRAHLERLRPHVVFHAAAHKHVPMMEDHPGSAVDNNLFGTRAVADAADATGVERFILISTDKAVRPKSVMGASKRLAEQYVQSLNARSTTGFAAVRFGNVLGSAGSVLEIWARQIADGGPVTITDPRMTRFFMTIPEAAALVIQAAALLDPTGEAAPIYVLDMGEPVSILDLAVRFVSAHGLDPVTPRSPNEAGAVGDMRLLFTGARPGEKLHEELATEPSELRPSGHGDINILMLPIPDERYIHEMLATLDPSVRPEAGGEVADRVRSLLADDLSVPLA